MTKREAIESIINRIEDIKDEYAYEFVGVRVSENAFTIGETLDNFMFGLMATAQPYN